MYVNTVIKRDKQMADKLMYITTVLQLVVKTIGRST